MMNNKGIPDGDAYEERKLEANEVMSNAFEIYQQTSPILERHFAKNERKVTQPAPPDKRDEAIRLARAYIVETNAPLGSYDAFLRCEALAAIDEVLTPDTKE